MIWIKKHIARKKKNKKTFWQFVCITDKLTRSGIHATLLFRENNNKCIYSFIAIVLGHKFHQYKHIYKDISSNHKCIIWKYFLLNYSTALAQLIWIFKMNAFSILETFVFGSRNKNEFFCNSIFPPLESLRATQCRELLLKRNMNVLRFDWNRKW